MTQDAIERELQFDCPDMETVSRWLLTQPRHAVLTFVPEGEKVQHDAYFDTADWSLLRGGYSLRLRRKADNQEVTLKATARRRAGVQERREISQSVAAEAELGGGEGPVLGRVRLMRGGRPLRRLFEVETIRRTFGVMREQRRIAEISLDASSISLEGESRRAFSRVEIEETASGGIELCLPFVQAMAAACSLSPSSTSKFEEGLEAAGLAPERVFDFGATTLGPEGGAAAYAYALMRQHWREVLAHEPGTRLGEDPEALHDMRVAGRRLRSVMSTFRPVLPPEIEPLRQELGWIGRCLGEVRDLDVQIEAIEQLQVSSGWDEANALGPLLEELRRRDAEARTRLLGAVDGERFQALVQDLGDRLRAGAPDTADGPPVVAFAESVIRKRYRQFRREARAITPESPPEAYHACRVRAKRLRYAATGFIDLYGSPAIAFIEPIKAAQDLLGEHQDAAVSIEWLRGIAMSHAGWPPLTLLRIGEIMERRRSRMAEIREEWPAAHRAIKARWRALQKVARRTARMEEAGPEEAAMAEELPASSIESTSAGAQPPGRLSTLRHLLRRDRQT